MFLALSRRHSLFWLLLASIDCSWLPLLVIHHSWFLLVVIPYVWFLLVFISCFHTLALLPSYVDSFFLVPSCCLLACFGYKTKNSSLKFLTSYTAGRCAYAVNLGKFRSLTRGPCCKDQASGITKKESEVKDSKSCFCSFALCLSPGCDLSYAFTNFELAGGAHQ